MSRAILLVLSLAAAGAAGPPDRRVAKWTLWMGGRVGVAGRAGLVNDIAQLPAGDLRVEVLDWVGINVDPPDLERLTGLTRLKALHLPGPMWSRNADGGRDGSRDTKYLAPLTTLETLTFSDHFLDRIRFRDSGLAEIAALANLRELAVRQSEVQGHTLAPFRRLEALDVRLCPFDDVGMKALEAATALRRLWIGDTLVTDAGLASLGSLVSLEDLDLHGTAVTDAGLANLKGLGRLRKLNLMGTAVTDEGLGELAGLARLEELNLYRTRVSNAGLARLKPLGALAQIDLRYTRATRAGVESLRAALPAARIAALEQSVRPAPSRDAGHLPLEAWVRALGGTVGPEAISLARTAVLDEDLARLRGLPRLRRLDLEATEIGDLGLAHLAALPLEELNLASTTVTDQGLRQLRGMPTLRRLRLRNTYVQGDGLAAFPALEELDLGGSPVTNHAVAALGRIRILSLDSTDVSDGAPLGALASVESLDLSSTDLTDAGLAPLAALSRLRTLILRDARFSDTGLAHLAGLTGLRTLDLVRTRISDPGLASLAKLTNLSSLALDYGEISDAGLAHLANLTKLESLSLDSTHVAGAAALRGFSRLKSLNLYHTLVDEKTLQELKAALPGCTIIWDAGSRLPNRRRS